MQNVGLVGRTNTKINRSWDARDPDDTLSTARAKSMMGEPWYHVVSGDTIAMHPTWMSTYLTNGRVLMNASIPIRAQCHQGIVNGLQAALSEIAGAGLGGHIDVGNTNTYGGCFNPRYSRNSGFLSRHAYAMAIDMNTTSNCQGCVPQMNCSVVRIFRKHGFAWGGNFRQPDGMHFEWVGEAGSDPVPVAVLPEHRLAVGAIGRRSATWRARGRLRGADVGLRRILTASRPDGRRTLTDFPDVVACHRERAFRHHRGWTGRQPGRHVCRPSRRQGDRDRT